MPEPDTLCGYGLGDVRKAVRDAVDRRDRRAALRWTAELIATPGAIGSLWAAYWVAWATAQGAGSASVVIPILLRQTWDQIASAAKQHTYQEDGWVSFRNDPDVRAIASEMTQRLLEQSRQTPVIWPAKDILLYDVGTMRAAAPPPASDGAAVLRVWQRDDDAMELRMMAGRFLDAMERGELRQSLSALAWTLLPTATQGLAQPLRIAERGPGALPPKARQSPIWFWLDLGRAALTQRTGLHRGWLTFHNAVVEAFKLHWRRWTAADRMRILLAWILHLRASYVVQPTHLWEAAPIQLTIADIDLPYQEIAAERGNPQAVLQTPAQPKQIQQDEKKAVQARMESKMAEADAAVLAAMGLADEDL
jgi:hypothetical protein